MMNRTAALLIGLAASSGAAQAGQHQDHLMPGQAVAAGAPVNLQPAAGCVQTQERASALIEQISGRLETAQHGNSPADMRNAIEDLQAALSRLRTSLRDCAAPTDASAIGMATSKPALPVDHAAMGHAAPTTKPAEVDQQLVNACVQGQRDAAGSTERQIRRLELARQTNGAAEMRAGISGLQAALGDLRTELDKCGPLRTAVAAAEAAAAATTMDHSKMVMGGAAPIAGGGAKPAAPMDHSKMAMGATPPVSKPGTVAGKPAKPAAPMDHSKMPMGGAASAGRADTAASAKAAKPTAPTDHSKMAMGDKAPAAAGGDAAIKMETPKLPVVPAQRIADPACPNNVTQANAPKATYQRKVYYFCSTTDRDLFRKDPAAYLKKRPR